MRFVFAAALLLLLASPALAQEGSSPPDSVVTSGEGAGSDSTAVRIDTESAPADATVDRTLISTDGAVSVYEEREPGEGIEGFWWEYDGPSDLARLLDKDERATPLEPLRDPFGFELVIPDTIRALRDSVTVVADSILASRIELETSFDPKLKSEYKERKDQFELVNEVLSPIPISGKATLSTKVTDRSSFNESTRKVIDSQDVNATLTFKASELITSTLGVTRNSSEQRRDRTLENDSGVTTFNGRAQAVLEAGTLGTVQLNAGGAYSQRNYETPATDGERTSLTPSWGISVNRPLPAGNVSLDYSGSLGRGSTAETRPEVITLPDSSTVVDTVRTSSDDADRSDQISFASSYDLRENWTLRANADLGQDQTQYLSQVDSLVGQQETRSGGNNSGRLRLEAEPWEALSLRGGVNVSSRETRYDLERNRNNRTGTQAADAEVKYDPWTGGDVTVKLDRQHEDRDFESDRAGTVDKQSASFDYKQKILTIDFNAGYFISLDSYAFDVENSGERDLFQQRATFTVRHTPVTNLNASVKFETREQRSININRINSAQNKTDYTYLITPKYTYKVGSASFQGEFSADARYSVFDFDEEKNFLTRTFGTRQRWQHAFSERFSTDVLATYDLSDEGSFSRSLVDGVRRYVRSREVRRYRLESSLLYTPRPGVRARFSYRRDGDDQYGIRTGEKRLLSESRTQELTAGLGIKRKVMRTIDLDLDVSHTQKNGDRVTELDKNYFVIRAALEYRPFKKPDKDKKK